jgi:hypothetical protein
VTYAQETKNPLALPEIGSMTLETYVSQSEKISKDFDNDIYLSFEVDLPKNLVERDFSVLKNREAGGRLYGEIYRKDSPALEDVRAYFSVRSFQLSRMISAKNWFVTWVMQNGYTLRGLESDKKGDNFEAFYVRLDDLGRTEIVRTKGFLRGPRIIMAEYVLPRLMWPDQKDVQIFAIKSFDLENINDNETAENLMSYVHMESFSMKYPQSWRLESDSTDLENQIDISFLTADDLRVVFATIDVTLTADQSLKDPIDRSRYPTNVTQIIKKRKDAVIAQEFLIGDVMERRQYDLSVDFVLQTTEIYPLRRKLTDYVTHRQAPVSREFWITVIKGTEETGKNYIVSMIAPSRVGASAKNWAIAAKAYEVMIESMR